VSKSTVYARQEAASSILNSAKRHLEMDLAKQRLFQQFADVVDQFIRLCNHTGSDKKCAQIPGTPCMISLLWNTYATH
jgi:hypothetical protein